METQFEHLDSSTSHEQVQITEGEQAKFFEKQLEWDLIAQKIDLATDGLGMPIDAGIKETVIAFNALGFTTHQSCEGHLERALGGPWIDITTPPNPELDAQIKKAYEIARKAHSENDPETEKLYKTYHDLINESQRPILELSRKLSIYLEEFYNSHMSSYNARIIIHPIYKGASRIESVGAFLQDIADPATKEVKLKEFQAEMDAFTKFLKHRFFSENN